MHVLVDAIGSSDLGCNENAVTKHELRGDIPETRLVREFIPHCTHERLSRVSGLFNGAVDVVDQIVSPIDGITNGIPHSACLEPWLPIVKRERQAHVLRVGAEEWIPASDLIEHDEEIVGGGSIETWNVRTAERMSSIAKLHDH